MKNPGGRPRSFDEDELIERISGWDDVLVIEAALVEHSSHPTWAPGCTMWLWRKKHGDPTGGVHAESGTRYRRMLAELPFDPLRPPGGRRRLLKAAKERGIGHLTLVTGLTSAGLVGLAFLSPSEALRAFSVAGAPIMLEASESSSAVEIPGPVLLRGPWSADGAREWTPGACASPDSVRVGSSLDLEAVAA